MDHIIIPYTQGLGKSIKNICNKFGIQTYFKGSRTLKDTLVAPKDKDTIKQKNWGVCWFRCSRFDCDEEYPGESSWTFGERYQEHLKASSSLFEHQLITGNSTTFEECRLVGREGKTLQEESRNTFT